MNNFFGCDTPAIADEIRQGGFDAFLVTGWYLKAYWQAIRACHREGVPVMVRGDSQLGTPRGWMKRLGKEVMFRRVLQHFDACLYVGARNREYLEHYGVAAKRLFFSPHCVDNDWFASRAAPVDHQAVRTRLGIAADMQPVLFAGKLIGIKRPLDMLTAIRVLRERGINACGVIAGDGPLRGLLAAEAQQWRVPLLFLGFLNQTELPEAYAVCDAMVLPSEGETWGLVVNEALACGTPVVVSDAVGCAPDLVLPGRTGVVYPAGDTLGLADALQQVLASPPGKHAISALVDAYSVRAAADGVLAAMDWLARNTGTSKR